MPPKKLNPYPIFNKLRKLRFSVLENIEEDSENSPSSVTQNINNNILNSPEHWCPASDNDNSYLSFESLEPNFSIMPLEPNNTQSTEILTHAQPQNIQQQNSLPSTPVLTADNIFNSLRVPDAIKDLPKFEGNPKLLFEFINNCEEILDLINCTSGTPYGQLLLRAIRNKIVGPANEVLNMYGTPLIWDNIRENLILHYSDKRNETSLIRDLHGLKQGGKTVENFYSEVIEILATMTNNVQIHERDEAIIQSKRDLYTEMSLNVFLSGLREPLGSTIRAMKPQTLAIAFSYCIKEQNISYSKMDTNSRNSNVTNNRTQPNFRQQPVNQQPRYQSFNRPRPQNFNFRNQGSSQNYRTNFNNYQRSNTPFLRQNNPNLPKPQPMEISTGETIQRPINIHRTNNSFRPQNQNFSNNRELYNISTNNIPPHQCSCPHSNQNPVNGNNSFQNLDTYYDFDHETPGWTNDNERTNVEEPTEDANFRSNASMNQLAL